MREHRPSTPLGENILEHLKGIHDYLRHDLEACQALAREVAAGASVEHIRAQVESLQTGSPVWQLRITCLHYCSFVHGHHGHEDAMFFPALQAANPDLRPVVEKLMADHRRVSGLLDGIEASAGALEAEDGKVRREGLVGALSDLASDLLAHLAFEEEALGPTIRGLTEWPY